MVREILKGEKRNIAMVLNREDEGDYEIETAEYVVHGQKRGGDSIQSGACEVNDKKVFFLADTTLTAYRQSNDYSAFFAVTVQGMLKRIKGRVDFRVVEGGE